MMARNQALRALALVTLAFAAALAWQRPAFAGTLQIRDEAHVLAPAGVEQLRSTVASAPFDARLVFTTDYADAQDLSRFVGSLVDEPNMVTVGVDPRHRHVQVHFGRGVGIARAEWPAIETAGNGAFREGNWGDGAAAVFRAASRSVTGNPATTPAGGHSPGVASVLLVLLVIGGVAAAVSLLARRRFMDGRPGGPGYGGPGYGGPGYGGYGGGPYGGPPPGGMGPLGGGLIGAGLGGLAGYELGKIEGEREQRNRGFGDTARQAPDDDFDAGGGGSSWDDGGGGGDDSGGFGGDGGDGGGSDF
jgi:hypothetical protein